MKQDIEFPNVEGVQIAIANISEIPEEKDWFVFLINTNDFEINNILITSKGYGFKEKEQQKTSTLRQHLELLAPKSFTKIERIVSEVFHLYNEYWVSYYVGKQIYDKKFIFVPESIHEDHLTQIDILNLEGILHT